MPTSPKKIRFAVAAPGISSFEAPFFRLCAQVEEWEFKVFYCGPVENKPYSNEYQTNVSWGVDLLGDYSSLYVEERKKLCDILQDWRPDVVLVYGYGWPGALSLILRNRLRGLPQIHRGTLNYFLDPRRGWKGRLMRPLRDFLFRLFTAHHYGGDYSRKVLLDAGVKPESLFFMPYSVDSSYFAAQADGATQREGATAMRRALGWTDNDQVLLFIAHHTWVKGPDIMLDIFERWGRENPQARLLMAGSGPMTEDLKRLAAARLAPKQYHFAGFVPSAETAPYYLAADLVVCASRYETWARMINEAMLCRRPCLINSRVAAAGGLVEDDRNGYVVPSPDVEPDAAAYVAILRKHFAKTPDERQKMGEAARERAKYFSYEAHMDDAKAAARYALARGKRR
ncbi:MAG: glycosyltransferase family 4 protein [Desulfobulbaceae bacterium]|jgi:glycosyltransferase involved in cell wall biosynthesis|nr:glycosyltransferase family 4 protein [Desulfobulbaceae bacterium]